MVSKCIYMYTNKLNGRKYIGKSIKFRKRHLEHCRGQNSKQMPIDRAFKKYGKDNFALDILADATHLSDEDAEDYLYDLEKYYIWKFNTFEDDNHYNLTVGGDGLGSGKNHPMSQRTGEKHHLFGKHRSEETRAKISKNHHDVSGENNPMYNHKGINCPTFKNYARVIKYGFNSDGKQQYALMHNGKEVCYSIFKEKLQAKADKLNEVVL